MGHISIFGNNLQSFNSFGVAYDIVEENGSIFLNPKSVSLLLIEGEVFRTMAVRNLRDHLYLASEPSWLHSSMTHQSVRPL